ncbi:MAG: hypothetical protein LBE36_08725 [Flavobacteriaceae bacterium]|nr:hypothetical protein [Flavobacteriaceae bacterium]
MDAVLWFPFADFFLSQCVKIQTIYFTKKYNKLSKEILAGNIQDGQRIALDYFKESGLVFREVE